MKTTRQLYYNPSNEPKTYSYPTTPTGSPVEQTVPPGGEFEAPKNYEKFFKRSGFEVGPAPSAAKSAPAEDKASAKKSSGK